MADDATASTPSSSTLPAPATPATQTPSPTPAAVPSAAGDTASLSPDETRARSARRRGPRALPRRSDVQPRPARKSGRKTDKRDAKAASKPSDPPAATLAAPTPPSPLEQAVAAIRAGNPLELGGKVDVNKRTPRGDVLLVEACRYARADVAAVLIQEHGADVNATSANKAANRTGLSPLIAACMALQPAIVDLLLQQPGVNLLQVFGKVNAAVACVVFSVPNGRTEQQNAAAIEILERLIDYAHRTQQLEKLLTAQADNVNALLHVAAALSNWRAVKLLQDKQQQYGVNVSEASRNARGHTALHALEVNAFQARSLQFCEPPRPNNNGSGAEGKKGKRRQPKRKGKQQADNDQDTATPATQPEPESEAGMWTDGEAISSAWVLTMMPRAVATCRQADVHTVSPGPHCGSRTRDAHGHGAGKVDR
jgi:ankyrin repeat protein